MLNSQHVSKEPVRDFDGVKAAGKNLHDTLLEKGIRIGYGVSLNAEGNVQIAIILQPIENKLSDQQIQEVKAIKNHNGFPVEVQIVKGLRFL